MIKRIKSLSKTKKVLLGIVSLLLVISLGVSFGYYAGVIGLPGFTKVGSQSATVDALTFKPGKGLYIYSTIENFGDGDGSLSDSTTTSATLVANNDSSDATQYYNVLLNITENEYQYTSSTNSPELVLTITDPNGNILDDVTGLNYVEVKDSLTDEIVKGFDITEEVGLSKLVSNYEIKTTSSTTGTTQNWGVKLTYLNLDTNQSLNAEKKLKTDVILTRDDAISSDRPFIEFADNFNVTSSEWINENVKVDITVNDFGGSGVKEKLYCISSIVCDPDTTLTTDSITISEDGTHIICTTVTGNNNLSSKTCTKEYKIDKTLPDVGAFDIKGTLGNNGWYTSVVEIGVNNGHDDLSGEDITYVSKDVISEDTNGEVVALYTLDKAGNESTISTTIKKDSTPPVISGYLNQNLEINTSFNILNGVSCEDNLSSKGSCTVSANPSTIDMTKAGSHNVEYISEDRAGNVTKNTVTIKVFADEPAINFTVPVNTINGNGWANENFDVTIDITDYSGLGIKESLFCVSSTECTPTTNLSGDKVSVTSEGDNVVCIKSTDNDNKVSEGCSEVYKLDKTNPTVGTINLPTVDGDNGWYVSSIVVGKTNGSDSLSGHYSTSTNISAITSDTKSTTITLTTTDLAGNTSTTTKTVKKDATAPVVGTINLSGTMGSNSWYTSNITVSASGGSDATSGPVTHTLSGSNLNSSNQITANVSSTTITLTTKDAAGNTRTTTRTVKKDSVTPGLVLKTAGTATITLGDSVSSSSYFTMTQGISAASLSCSPSNTSSFTTGLKTISCTVTGGNGLKKTLTKTIDVLPPPASEYLPSIHDENDGLYQHTSNLTNGAKDNNFRYSGEVIKNYICFGTDFYSCSGDNLFRIVGIFNNGTSWNLKIMKNAHHEILVWNDANSINDWSTSSLNAHLHNNYYNTFANVYKAMIETYEWNVGKSYPDGKIYESHLEETVNQYSNKIGLITLSEYGWGLSPSYWSTDLYNIYQFWENNWIGTDYVYTLTASSRSDDKINSLYEYGRFNESHMAANSIFTFKPTFYLKSDVYITSGTGEIHDPFRIDQKD